MLVRYTAYYALARGVPGLLNFLSIAIYTRLLSPADYGIYALIVVWVGLANVVFFQWIRVSLLRFFPAHLDCPGPFLGTLLLAYTTVVTITGLGGLALLVAWHDTVFGKLILLAVPLVWIQAGFELSLELLSSQLKPVRYGLMSGVRAGIALALGVLLILWGFGVYGPLLAMLLGMLVATVGLGLNVWRDAQPSLALLPKIRPLLIYGMPLTATFALEAVVSSSDRLILAWLLSPRMVGEYSATYDLVAQVITLLLMSVHLAAYPLAVRMLEQHGREAAGRQLLKNGSLLLIVAVPVTLGFIALGPQIVAVLLGVEFRDGATALVPWITLAIFVAGIRFFHFDLAFQLSEKTLYQVWISATAAITNVILNMTMIPIFGVLGAAYATLIAYLVALGLSVVLGRRLFPVRLITADTLKVLLAGVFMVIGLWPMHDEPGLLALVGQVVWGAVIYTGILLLVNVSNMRSTLLARIVE